MGGPGSGNWWPRGSKRTCETLAVFDLRHLTKRGLLAAGRVGRLICSFDSKATGTVSYRIHTTDLELAFFNKHGDVGPIQRVRLAYTPQALGGRRCWLVCPMCGRRCLMLYGWRHVSCRKCQGLAYRSQQQGPEWRALVQAQRHRQELGGSGDIDEPFPTRPRYMHRRTYERALARADELDQLVLLIETLLQRRMSAIERKRHSEP